MVVTAQSFAVGAFSNRQEAEDALNELKASGFAMERVSIIAKNAQDDRLGDAKISDRVGEQSVQSPTAVVADLATGSAWGAVLVGLSSLVLPGVGPVLAAGSLGVALLTNLGGVALGTAANASLVRALADLGIPEEQARIYSDRLLQGHYLVIVDGTDDEIHRAENIFSNRGIQDWGTYHPSKG